MKAFMKRWWSFSGRCRRLRYFLCALLAPIVTLITAIVLLFIAFGILGFWGVGVQTDSPVTLTVIAVLLGIWMLFFSVSVLSFGVRRLHDINLSGWWILLPWVVSICIGIFFPHFLDSSSRPLQFLLGFWPTLFLLFMPGSKGENKYGIEPEKGLT